MISKKLVIILIIFLTVFITYPYLRSFSFKSIINTINFKLANGALYECDEGKSIKSIGNNDTITIYLSDGRKYSLLHILSASGLKFSNENKKVSFWSKGKKAFLQEGTINTYENCVERLTAD